MRYVTYMLYVYIQSHYAESEVSGHVFNIFCSLLLLNAML